MSQIANLHKMIEDAEALIQRTEKSIAFYKKLIKRLEDTPGFDSQTDCIECGSSEHTCLGGFAESQEVTCLKCGNVYWRIN